MSEEFTPEQLASLKERALWGTLMGGNAHLVEDTLVWAVVPPGVDALIGDVVEEQYIQYGTPPLNSAAMLLHYEYATPNTD
jgi:hypothetical protein